VEGEVRKGNSPKEGGLEPESGGTRAKNWGRQLAPDFDSRFGEIEATAQADATARNWKHKKISQTSPRIVLYLVNADTTNLKF